MLNIKLKPNVIFWIKLVYANVIIVLFVLFIIGSVIINLPIPVLISIFALVTSTLALFYNRRILNSLAIPFTFIYFFVTMYDLIQLNILFFSFHIGTVVACFIIFFRKKSRTNTSLILMLIVSVIYAFWVLSILATKHWIYFPYYDCVFMICGVLYQFFGAMTLGIFTSLLASYEKIISFSKSVFKNWNSKINKKRLDFNEIKSRDLIIVNSSLFEKFLNYLTYITPTHHYYRNTSTVLSPMAT